MRKTLAMILRKMAQSIDAQPHTIELVLVEAPVEELNGLIGRPVYFFRTAPNSFTFYPTPDADIRLRCVV